jgi:sporulation protein YlmC with PRC-barrel domain
MATFATGKGPGPKVMGASTLIGDKVVNAQGENLGKIEEFMIDMDTGNVNYAVLSFGGFLGMGDKLFAIPFQSLHLDTEHKQMVLNVEKERLENAPGFDKDNWPVMSQEWGEGINRYYNIPHRDRSIGVEKRGDEYRH